MFRTITAGRAGTCRRCRQEFPEGMRIRWAPRAGSYHLAADCTDARSVTEPRVSRYVRTGPRTLTRCTHEDYPCCGCER